MAEFSKLVITNKGQALLAKMIAGSGNIEFTKISSSSTAYTDAQLEGLTSLSNVKQTSLISKITRTNEVAIKVEAVFTNTELTVGYYMKALGLYAVDPDAGEILYAVTRETSGNCYMPAYNGITVSGAYVQLVTTVGNAKNVSLEVDAAAVATIGDIQDLQKQIAALEAGQEDIPDRLTERLGEVELTIEEQAGMIKNTNIDVGNTQTTISNLTDDIAEMSGQIAGVIETIESVNDTLVEINGNVVDLKDDIALLKMSTAAINISNISEFGQYDATDTSKNIFKPDSTVKRVIYFGTVGAFSSKSSIASALPISQTNTTVGSTTQAIPVMLEKVTQEEDVADSKKVRGVVRASYLQSFTNLSDSGAKGIFGMAFEGEWFEIYYAPPGPGHIGYAANCWVPITDITLGQLDFFYKYDSETAESVLNNSMFNAAPASLISSIVTSTVNTAVSMNNGEIGDYSYTASPTMPLVNALNIGVACAATGSVGLYNATRRAVRPYNVRWYCDRGPEYNTTSILLWTEFDIDCVILTRNGSTGANYAVTRTNHVKIGFGAYNIGGTEYNPVKSFSITENVKTPQDAVNYLFGVIPALPATADLDDIKTPGRYMINYSDAQTITNMPVDSESVSVYGYLLEVQRFAQYETGGETIQTLRGYRSGDVYWRGSYNGGWDSWYKLEGTEVSEGNN